MKVVILTSKPHWKFINDGIREHHGHDFWVSEATTFPNEYDIGISFMHLGKIPAEHVNTHKWYNFHPGPLPEYKGRNLCYHAIMNGEKEFGATIHYMDENFDTGDIIHVQRFPIWNFWTALDLSEMTINVSKYMFAEFLPRVLAGEEFERHPNSDEYGYYGKSPIPDTLPLADDGAIAQFVRAVYYPPYYPKIEIGGVKYKIVRDE